MSRPTIIPSEYGLGEIAPAPERARVNFKEPELIDAIQRYGWSSDELDEARAMGLPAPVAFRNAVAGGLLRKRTALFDLVKVEAWELAVRRLAASLPR